MFFGYCYKNKTSCSKNCYQKASHNATEATGEFIGTKITNKIVKSKLMSDVNSKNVEEIVFHQKKEKGYWRY